MRISDIQHHILLAQFSLFFLFFLFHLLVIAVKGLVLAAKEAGPGRARGESLDPLDFVELAASAARCAVA